MTFIDKALNEKRIQMREQNIVRDMFRSTLMCPPFTNKLKINNKTQGDVEIVLRYIIKYRDVTYYKLIQI